MTPKPRRLWHYCCDHSLDGILQSGTLKPLPRGVQRKVSQIYGSEVMAFGVVWLTDIDVRNDHDVEVLGLTRVTGLIECDRVEFRFRAPTLGQIWWPDWADEEMAAGRLAAQYRSDMEFEAEPEHWWVSPAPIPGVRLDERYRRP